MVGRNNGPIEYGGPREYGAISPPTHKEWRDKPSTKSPARLAERCVRKNRTRTMFASGCACATSARWLSYGAEPRLSEQFSSEINQSKTLSRLDQLHELARVARQLLQETPSEGGPVWIHGAPFLPPQNP